MSKINLLWLSNKVLPPEWKIGEVFTAEPDTKSVNAVLQKFLDSAKADAWLLWDPNLGEPDPTMVMNLLHSPDDVWHAGLLLGTSGQPDFINYVSPTWMLNRDPDPHIEATSWRLSLRACLIRTEVLRQIGSLLTGFDSIEAAGLELGHRYIRSGVFVRHVPRLVTANQITQPPVHISLEDQLKFIAACYGRKWLYWSGLRAVLSGHASLTGIIRALKKAREFSGRPKNQPYIHSLEEPQPSAQPARVSVLIPTVNRYPYLRTLLDQLRRQTIKPTEIIVVDQTPLSARDERLQRDFADLPLRWFYLEHAGQCSSRNLGLAKAIGDYILFLDDDDEIPDNLIASHLTNLRKFRCNISNGAATEPGFEDLAKTNSHVRISDVFPTNNTIIRKDVLERSGLFDLAYDHGQRADHDLGTRIYLAGERMILDPGISVLHHHAPQGGLREHKARVITRVASKRSVWLKVLPSISDIYLSKRYFTKVQVREMLWISLLSTFTMEGPLWRRLLKSLVSLLTLPYTLLKFRSNEKKAQAMLVNYPVIPSIDHAEG